MKVYVIYDGNEWSLSTEKGQSGELASIKHLNTELAKDGTHFDGEVEVVEGIYFWHDSEQRYFSKKPFRQPVPKNNSNTISRIMYGIGLIIILIGFVAGLLIGSDNNRVDLNVIIPYWAGAFISGMLFIGFSEVIKLLHQINEKLNNRIDR